MRSTPAGGLTTRCTVAGSSRCVTSWNISPMLTTNAPGSGGTSTNVAVALDLQAADVVLVHEREEAGVAVGADALVGRAMPSRRRRRR